MVILTGSVLVSLKETFEWRFDTHIQHIIVVKRSWKGVYQNSRKGVNVGQHLFVRISFGGYIRVETLTMYSAIATWIARSRT
jgi:hypothetical protein